MRAVLAHALAIALTSLLSGVAGAGGGGQIGPPDAPGATWLVIMRSASAPADQIAGDVARLGGAIVGTHPEVGTFVVQANDPGFPEAAASIPGVSSVLPNVRLPVILDEEAPADGEGPAVFLPADEPLYALQWGLHAIHAKGAWDAGYTGAGVRVAVLDSTFDLSHPGLAANINADLARSFVPGESIAPPPGADFSHGTLVAGVIAAAADGVGTSGVAPGAELVPIKVVGDDVGVTLPAFLDGVAHAVAVQADVANMSFAAVLPKSGFCDPFSVPPVCVSAREVRDIATLVQRAVRSARRNGVTMITAAGNDALELNRRDDTLWLPVETKGVLAVSSLGPIAWALDPSTDLDVPVGSTNFGERVVYLSAGGGQFTLGPTGPIPTLPPDLECDLGFGLGLLACWRFDGVLTTSLYTAARPSFYGFGFGTSFAAPHVAGVAALVIGKSGGALSPGRVQAILRRSADDLGPPGRDDFFGWGRVNAERAIEMTPAAR